MNLQAWGEQRARYSRARRGRGERGAAVGECALIQAVTEAMGLRGATARRGPELAVADRGHASVGSASVGPPPVAA